jgi:hypothetical protein
MALFTLVDTWTGEALYPYCSYKTARGAKIAASKAGYDAICAVSEYSYNCYDFETKVDGKWIKDYKKMKPDKTKCVIRLESHLGRDRLALFYWDDYGVLTCLTRAEGHSAADLRYYRQNTKPVEYDAEAIAFFKAYDTDGQFRLMQRL